MDQQPDVRTIIIREQSNGVGLAGFICSMVGLVSCGVLSPVGAILSFIGMFRAPRGFAIAGFVIGLAGSVWVFVMIFVIGVASVAAALGWKELKATGDMVAIEGAVSRYVDTNGALPGTLGALPQAAKLPLSDPWGHPYRFVPDDVGKGYTLSSDGPDGKAGTADDVNAYSAHVEYNVDTPKK